MTGNKNGTCESKKQNGRGKDVKDTRVDDDFVPPDGGWGWIIVLATGFSNFCVLPLLQSFGLIFKDKFEEMGISSSETTTLVNVNCAVTACIGLANGPVFKKYSYRQVAFAGALLCAISITILSKTNTFTGSVIFFSVLYGAGVGITMSSNALALNTYFKEKRRVATGLSWTCTGMGPIVMPQIITLLMPAFGMEGTVLIFGGFAFNAVACALLLQPVSSAFHSRSLENVVENEKVSSNGLRKSKQKFGSQYLYYDDDENGAAGIDVMESGTPMMSRANDGWFSRRNSSNASLASKSSRKDNNQKAHSRVPSVSLSRQSSVIALSRGPSVRTLNRQNSETDNWRRKISANQTIPISLISVNESCEHVEADVCKHDNCNRKKDTGKGREKDEFDEPIDEDVPREVFYKRFCKAIVIFFDLDLLRDLVYVNLMLGITFANFAELNFALLTPFVLGEYGFTRNQVATVMSILGGVDVVTRITIPFVASFIGWENRTFFLVGVLGMALGRVVLAHIHDYGVAIAVAVLIGAGKALRTIFMALVIPTHVPLSRLPAATGLQLLVSGVVSLVLGPAIGWIRDASGDYAVLLHCLNIFTYLTAISWTAESWYRRMQERKRASSAKEEARQRLNA